MHGLFFRAFENFVTDSYGPEAWTEIARIGGQGYRSFESMLDYPESISKTLVLAAAQVLDNRPGAILEDVGTYLVSHPRNRPLKRLLRFGGATFRDFLLTLDDLADWVSLAVPDLDPPRLELLELGAGRWDVVVHAMAGAERPIVGIIRAMADDYGALVLIEADSGSGRIAITLAEEEPQAAPGGPVQGNLQQALEAGRPVLDRLLPLHLGVSSTGHIIAAGPTARRLLGAGSVEGARLLEVFEVLRPRDIHTIAALEATAGRRLHLRPRARGEDRVSFKAVFVPLVGGGILDLSFGIGAVEAVAGHGLTAAELAPTDLTSEMLYLAEAKSSIMAELKRLNHRLDAARAAAESAALTDALTGLGNRRALELALSRALDLGDAFALMQIDLDRFKAVNDTMGHEAGDTVLSQVARVLRDVTRSGDQVARFGGDEFVVLFKGLSDGNTLEDIAARLIAGVEAPIVVRGGVARISASAGTTLSRYYAQPEAEKMLADADQALYEAKAAGRGRHVMFVPPSVTGRRRGDGQKDAAPDDAPTRSR